MPTATTSAWKQLQDTWARLSPQGRRAVLIAGVVAFAGLLVWAALSARGPAFAPLFTQLDAQDAAAIISKLESQKIPYRLAAQGTIIEVPQSEVYRLRIAMASQGLPSGGVVGFSIMNSLGIGSTPFQQRVDYLRALQGELTRTIEQIVGVQSARVHIVLPQQSAFLESQTPPASAAVLVRLQPGYTLSANEVRGITHLLASSVQGLKPSAVTIVDDHGRLLSAPGGSSSVGAGAASNDMQMQLTFDNNLQNSLVSLLTPVFGPDNVVAHVQADLNFDQKTITQNLFQPAATGPGLLRSMQQLKEQFTGQGTPPGGVPGTTSNVPTYPAITAASGPTNYTKTQTTQNFEVNQTQQRTVVAPGSVNRLSVAVIVNRSLTPAQQQLVLRTVQAAIGADPKRNDQIQVVGMPFSTSLAAQLAGKPAPATSGGKQMVLYEAGAGGAVLILALAALLLRRRGGKAAEQREAQLAQELLGDAHGPTVATPADETAEMADLLRRRPEDTANIVRAWLSEDE